ncbi:sn-glycerol-1-phosphate dehydrogenase [Desulfogranum marinum]|uniref:sn-glycerol-1-phosphate dehydrogenase n=1 Tax=Desulfogranum marinum TaxID=453220 RepID=UPI0029C6EC7E|nr:sn-glycerol-1-phosphate dehydrogenase [Desulfogranum marinum]
MDLTTLLGTTFDCACGRRHQIPTEKLIYGRDAFTALPQIVTDITDGQKCLLVADQRTWEKAGEKAAGELEASGLQVFCFIVPDKDGEEPTADEQTKDYLMQNAPLADLYIAVGSGVINDLVKWVAYLQRKPYVSVPTAASMNGYASANVAATVDGLKVLFHAEACRAVVANPDIINNAPQELTASGLGDVLAKSVSSADWKLNQLLFGDYYCQFAVDLLKDLEPIYLENPKQIRKKDPVALQALFEALFYSSVAMTMTGTSSPASGGEHLISHTLDMLAIRDNKKHDLHGRQVGVGSILSAAIYEKVMQLEKPFFYEVPQQVNQAFWGSLFPIVEKEYQQKLVRIKQAVDYLQQPANWQLFKKTIQPGLVPPIQLKKCLLEAGAAHRFEDIRYDGIALPRKKFVDIVTHANQMRQRFTILDLAAILGIIPDQLDALVDEWLS